MLDDIDINSISKVIIDTPFKLNQIKLSHYHFINGELSIGMPILTTIEIIKEYDNDGEKYIKKITHKYVSSLNNNDSSTSYYEDVLENGKEIFEAIENYDLRKLRNNFFTNKGIEKYQHYEIEYNYLFKIVGTYDNEIDEYKDIADILGFKEIIKDEINKTKIDGDE